VGPGDLLGGLSEASWLNDEPLAHGNDPHLLAISKYAKPHVTVLLSGEGADETLGGYVRYRPLRFPGLLRAARHLLPPAVRILGVGGRLGKLARLLEVGPLELMVLFNACETLPGDVRDFGLEVTEPFAYRTRILREAVDLYPGDAMRQAMYSDQHTFLASVLDRNDRMTMGASIECRVPFLDYRLVEGLAGLPSRILLKGWRGKHLLRRSVVNRLPSVIRRHRKWGFGVPWSRYLRDIPEWREALIALPGRAPILGGPFDRPRIEKVIVNFLAGSAREEALVRQLLMVVTWYEACVSGAGRPTKITAAPALL
jgi:asparagine synthase (glutamine-hydrolysing)